MSNPDTPGNDQHGGNFGLCSSPHFCPNCEAGKTDQCQDLFQHPICGLVSCHTFSPEHFEDDEE